MGGRHRFFIFPRQCDCVRWVFVCPWQLFLLTYEFPEMIALVTHNSLTVLTSAKKGAAPSRRSTCGVVWGDLFLLSMHPTPHLPQSRTSTHALRRAPSPQ